MNRWPWQGLKVKVHPLFWIVVCASVWTGHFIEVFTLFILVTIHELGHVTAAWSYGWRFCSIQLLPFGGVAQMDEMGLKPTREEIVVALAGPFHHIFMILLSLALFKTGVWSETWTLYFIQGNIMLACFNLLPIYPLDGGRVIQAMLSHYLPYQKCISLTYILGIILALTLMVFSVWQFFNVPLLLVVLFLLSYNIISYQNRQITFYRFLMQRHNKGAPKDIPLQKISVFKNDNLKVAINKWHKDRYHIIEVLDNNGVRIGVIPEEKLLDVYFNKYSAQLQIRELLLL